MCYLEQGVAVWFRRIAITTTVTCTVVGTLGGCSSYAKRTAQEAHLGSNPLENGRLVIGKVKAVRGPAFWIVAGRPYVVTTGYKVGRRRLDIGLDLELDDRVMSGPTIATSEEEAVALTWTSGSCRRGGYLVIFGRISSPNDVVLAQGSGVTKQLRMMAFPTDLHTKGRIVYGILPYGVARFTVRTSAGKLLLKRTTLPPLRGHCLEEGGNVRAK